MESRIISTHKIADDVVSELGKLPTEHNNPDTLKNIETIFINGSYIRGDWLEHCSDVDIGVVFSNGVGEIQQTPFGLRFISNAEEFPDYQLIKRIVRDAIGTRNFYSQTPGGVDILAYPEPPSIGKKNIEHTGPPMYHIFRFDLARNHKFVYGNPFPIEVPSPPISGELLLTSLKIAENRIKELDDSAIGRRRATYLCWRLIQKAQCFFGELTLNKFRMLYLYKENVPYFKNKNIGEFIIRQYIATFIPLTETKFLPFALLRNFHQELTQLIIERI